LFFLSHNKWLAKLKIINLGSKISHQPKYNLTNQLTIWHFNLGGTLIAIIMITIGHGRLLHKFKKKFTKIFKISLTLLSKISKI